MTKSQSVIVVAGLLLAIVTACKTNQTSSSSNANGNSSSAQSTPDHFAAIRSTWEKECKDCHGTKGTGGPVKLEDGTKLKVPSLQDERARRHPDSDYLKQITKGGDGMPAFEKKLTPEQMNELIGFIREVFQPGAVPAK